MQNHHESEDEVVLPFVDLVRVLRKRKGWILFITLIFASIGFFHAADKPLNYRVESIFRDRGKKTSGVAGNLSILFLGGTNQGKSEAVSFMESQRVLVPVIEQYGLQVNSSDFPSRTRVSRFWQNFRLQYTYLRKRKEFQLEEMHPPISFRHVSYMGKNSLYLTLQIKENDTYEVLSSDGTSLGEGFLGSSFEINGLQWTLLLNDPEMIRKEYSLKIEPLEVVLGRVRGQLTMKQDDKDTSLLELVFTCSSRTFGMEILNAVMQSYQDLLKREHEEYAAFQLDYLENRKSKTSEQHQKLMNQHAQTLSQAIRSKGFFNTEKVMEFLLASRLESIKQLHRFELEIERITALLKEDPISIGSILIVGTLEPIQEMFGTLEKLKQQRDSLVLALEERSRLKPKLGKEHFFSVQKKKKELFHRLQEIQTLLSCIREDKPIDSEISLLQDSRLMVSPWIEQLELQKKHGSKEETALLKEECITYLNHLKYLLDMHQKVLEERLNNRYEPDVELQGIDYKTANLLYLNYSKENNLVEEKIRQHTFVLEQLENPSFEINSLSSILTDPISQEIIRKAGDLALTLRDQENRSTKELERVRQGMTAQKRFFSAHLKQMNEMFRLRKDLFEEKQVSLQSISLELIHQQISLIEKRIRTHVCNHLASLEQEKKLAILCLEKLNEQMQAVPYQWVAEQQIRHSLNMNKQMIYETTRLVEGKNVAHNLEVIQSAPIDPASASLLPNSPKILFFTIIGALFGLVFSTGGTLFIAVVKGVLASKENLQLSHQHVSGSITKETEKETISSLPDTDLETLRRTLSFLRERGRESLLILGQGPDYSQALATLFSKKGDRVLLLSLCFSSSGKESSGLIQYLEGNVDIPIIQEGPLYDTIETGGCGRFGSEWVASPRFQQLMKLLQSKYDRILAVSDVSVTSAEAENILQQFPSAVVSLKGEKLADLNFYIKGDHETAVSFLFVH